MIRIFLDANVYFAGFHSPTGASHLILELVRQEKLKLSTSRLVLREADRNLRKKSTPKALKAFRRFLNDVRSEVTAPPADKITAPFESLLHPKDLPVLGAALKSGAEYLLSLDRKHFLTPRLQSRVKTLKIMSPGDFFRIVYLKGKI